MRASAPARLVLLALLAATSSARAQATADATTSPHARVALTVGPCPGVDESEVRRILPIELDTPLVAAPDVSALAVSVQCDGSRALVRVAATRPLERNLDLATTPAIARARFLSLAIAELVSVAATQRAAPPPSRAPTPPTAPPPPTTSTTPPPASTAAPTPPTEAPRDPPPPWLVEALVHERASLAAGLVAWGGGARLVHVASSGVEWAVDARGESGAVGVSLGSVDVTTGSLGASLGLRRSAGPLVLRGAAGARFGLSRLAGDPSNASATRSGSFLAAWGGPCLDLGVDAVLGSRLVLGLAGEAGADVVPAHGLVNGARDVDLGGAWVGARLSLGVLF